MSEIKNHQKLKIKSNPNQTKPNQMARELYWPLGIDHFQLKTNTEKKQLTKYKNIMELSLKN